jgi:WD40 repeat protein
MQALKEDEALIESISYQLVGEGFHQGEVSSLDVCVQRPVIVTLSKSSGSVKVWNYDTGVCELSKSFKHMLKENPNYLRCIALHPSGFYMAIGFSDKVKVYHLLKTDIREYRSLDIKNCNILRFSKGG